MFYTGSGYADCVNLLKCVSANKVLWDLTGNHYDGRRVHVGIGNSSNRIRCPRPGSNEHDTHSASRTGVTFRHVNGALLMSYQVMSQPIARSPQLVVDVQNWRSEERRVGKECRSRWSP